MAKKESLNLLNAYSFESINDTVKDNKEINNEKANIPVEDKQEDKKVEKKTTKKIEAKTEKPAVSEKKEDSDKKESYYMMIRLPKEYEVKLKVLAAQEYRGNLTKYIKQLITEDFEKRGIK